MPLGNLLLIKHVYKDVSILNQFTIWLGNAEMNTTNAYSIE